MLHPLNPIVVTHNNQAIRGQTVSGIIADGFSGVVVQNCKVFHTGTHGIWAKNCTGLQILNTNILCNSSPVSGANAAEYDNVLIYKCDGAVLNNVRVQNGSTGIYVQSSANVSISYLQGQNMRGPFPRGQLVQFDSCINPSLQNFSVKNDLSVCWTEDNISVFKSTGALIQAGLLDGNNSPSGDGVMFEQSTGQCIDVDVINWSNGAVGSAGSSGVAFQNVRARDSYSPCSQNRGLPLSNSLVFASINGASGTKLTTCKYYALVNPTNILFDAAAFASIDAVESDFVPRSYIIAQVPL